MATPHYAAGLADLLTRWPLGRTAAVIVNRSHAPVGVGDVGVELVEQEEVTLAAMVVTVGTLGRSTSSGSGWEPGPPDRRAAQPGGAGGPAGRPVGSPEHRDREGPVEDGAASFRLLDPLDEWASVLVAASTAVVTCYRYALYRGRNYRAKAQYGF